MPSLQQLDQPNWMAADAEQLLVLLRPGERVARLLVRDNEWRQIELPEGKYRTVVAGGERRVLASGAVGELVVRLRKHACSVDTGAPWGLLRGSVVPRASSAFWVGFAPVESDPQVLLRLDCGRGRVATRRPRRHTVPGLAAGGTFLRRLMTGAVDENPKASAWPGPLWRARRSRRQSSVRGGAMKAAPTTAGASLIPRLKERLRAGHAALRDDFVATRDAARLLRRRCRLIDEILGELWDTLALPDSLALVAVGGYGRGELYPASDVDLLLLLPELPNDRLTEQLEQLVCLFWDVGLETGHSVRTLEQCLEEAASDITVQTSMIEARLLAGNRRLFEGFRTLLRSDSNPQDIRAGATPIAKNFIVNNTATGKLLNSAGRVVAQKTVTCRRK